MSSGLETHLPSLLSIFIDLKWPERFVCPVLSPLSKVSSVSGASPWESELPFNLIHLENDLQFIE